MIKVSTLHSVLHEKDKLCERSRAFLQSIEAELGESLEISQPNDYDCDLKLIFIETGGSEMLFKNAMADMKEPFFFITSGESNSLAATLEILTYLNEKGLKGEILHGSPRYIAERIRSLEKKSLPGPLEGKRYGVIGKPSDWLIASIPDYEEARSFFGCELIDIDLKELLENFSALSAPSVDAKNFDKAEVAQAEKVYLALEKIVEKYGLDGFTLRCFDLLDTIRTTGCLALAKFNAKGIIGTCEGDVMAMLSMAVAKAVSGESSFQANPSRIDTETGEILFAHCTVPLDMLSSFTYKTHFESGIGVAIKGEMKELPVTVLRLSANLKNNFVGFGKIIANRDLDNLCRTQIVVKMEDDVRVLLTNPSGNHHIIFYGDYRDKLRNLI